MRKEDRLFEEATREEWAAAEFNGHLDAWQALRHLASGKAEIVRIRITPEKLPAKRKATLEYARRLKLSVKTRFKNGWLLIKDASMQRQVSKKRGRLEREFV